MSVPLGVKKSDAAYHHVRRRILLGEEPAGAVLLEQKIAADLHCSQGTAREALMRLEQDGLVQRRGYRGTVVLLASEIEVSEMVQIRIGIERRGLYRSVPQFSAESAARLDDLAGQMDAAVAEQDYYRASELDRRYHLTLLQFADLPSLEPIFLRCALHMHRITFMHVDENLIGRNPGATHQALTAVIARRDPDAAADALQAHVHDVLRQHAPRLAELAFD